MGYRASGSARPLAPERAQFTNAARDHRAELSRRNSSRVLLICTSPIANMNEVPAHIRSRGRVATASCQCAVRGPPGSQSVSPHSDVAGRQSLSCRSQSRIDRESQCRHPMFRGPVPSNHRRLMTARRNPGADSPRPPRSRDGASTHTVAFGLRINPPTHNFSDLGRGMVGELLPGERGAANGAAGGRVPLPLPRPPPGIPEILTGITGSGIR